MMIVKFYSKVFSCYWCPFKCWPVEASAEIKFDIFMWLLLSNQPTQNSIHSEDKSPRCLKERKWPNIFTRCCLIFIQKQTILQILEKCYIWWSYFEPIVFYWCFEWRVLQSVILVSQRWSFYISNFRVVLKSWNCRKTEHYISSPPPFY